MLLESKEEIPYFGKPALGKERAFFSLCHSEHSSATTGAEAKNLKISLYRECDPPPRIHFVRMIINNSLPNLLSLYLEALEEFDPLPLRIQNIKVAPRQGL